MLQLGLSITKDKDFDIVVYVLAEYSKRMGYRYSDIVRGVKGGFTVVRMRHGSTVCEVSPMISRLARGMFSGFHLSAEPNMLNSNSMCEVADKWFSEFKLAIERG